MSVETPLFHSPKDVPYFGVGVVGVGVGVVLQDIPVQLQECKTLIMKQ